MKIVQCEQNSPEWGAARAGRATASEFKSVLAKGKGITRASYLRKVASERLTGIPFDGYHNGHMDRGSELEPFARALYEVTTETWVDTVGLILHDDLMAACSPDGLIGDDGGLEIKSVIPTVQLQTIVDKCVPSEHVAQIQGNLWISERRWWHFASYCPEMPDHLKLFIVRVERDEPYIAAMRAEVVKFLAEVDALLLALPKAGGKAVGSVEKA